MIPLLKLVRNGQSLDFNSDNTVVTTQGKSAAGTWTAHSDESKNRLTYTPAATATGEPIDVTYGVNTNNQLTVAVPAQGVYAAAAEQTFPGYISVESRNDFVYYVLENEDPNSANFAFYIYGGMQIDAGANELRVQLGAGNILKIKGTVIDGHTALSASQGDGGLDLLEFSAVTHNDFGAKGVIDLPAEISISGVWDIHDGQIKFVGGYDSTGTTPTFYVAIAGQLKGVAAGFEFYSADGKSQLLFTLQGEIKGVDQNGKWSFSLGYARKMLTASGDFKNTIVTSGGSLVLGGSFNVAKGAGALTFDVNLKATWNLRNGQISVAIKGSNRNYTLSLAGNLTIGNNWNVSFQLNNSSTGAPSFSITIGNASADPDLKTQLQLFFKGNKLTLTANIAVTLTYVNGMLLPEPKPAAVKAQGALP